MRLRGILTYGLLLTIGTTAVIAQPSDLNSDLTIFPNSAVTAAENDAFAGRTERLSPPGPVLLGQGFSRLSFAARDRAVQVDRVTEQRSELQVAYNFELIDSYAQLARSLQVDASASVQYIGGSASARLNLLQSAMMTNQAVYVLVSIRVTNTISQLNSFVLNETALRQMATESPQAFYTRYGDGFIYRMGSGSEMYALLEVHAREETSRESLRAEVAGSYGVFSASANVATAVESLSRDRQVKVYYSQSGGNIGEAVTAGPPSTGSILVLSANELILRTRHFVREAREHPENAEIIWADVLDYTACRNRPATFVPFDTTYAMWALSELGSLHLELRQIAESWEFYILNRERFVAGTNAPTSEDLSLLRDLIRRIERSIRYLAVTPSRAQSSSVTDILKLRVLVETVRRMDQASTGPTDTIRAFLESLDVQPVGGPELTRMSCLARPTASSQLACLLGRAVPALARVAPCISSGEITVNGDFPTLQTIPLPNDCVQLADRIPEVWLSLTMDGREQFDLAHVVRSVTPTAVNFQVCVRSGGDLTCGCQGYGGLRVRWVARRTAP